MALQDLYKFSLTWLENHRARLGETFLAATAIIGLPPAVSLLPGLYCDYLSSVRGERPDGSLAVEAADSSLAVEAADSSRAVDSQRRPAKLQRGSLLPILPRPSASSGTFGRGVLN